MNFVTQYFRDLYEGAVRGWDRFWFSTTDPATYCLIRVLAGSMLLYTHAVWTLGLLDFFGPHSWVSKEALDALGANGTRIWQMAFSYLWWISDSPTLLWITHGLALAVFAMLTVGWHSRVVSVLAFFIAASYCNRSPASIFGLDQINCLLAMYLMVGPSGACYSVDRWLQKRRWRKEHGDESLPPVEPSVGANIGIRLIQVHMCIMYLFAGLGKLAGTTWWDGTAFWGAVANLEYQSIDITWLGGYPLLINVLTHVTVWWEVSYWALVWPRLTRPIVIALAVPLHLGIAFFLGMITFGTAMLFGNLAFVSPWIVRAVIDRRSLRMPETPAERIEPQRGGKRRKGKSAGTPVAS